MQNVESDIDIALKSSKIISKNDIFYLRQELENLSGKDIDLINLDDIGEQLQI